MWESPIDDFGLLLPAFVMPNHPSLRPILDDASRRLAAAGLSSGLLGYQGDAAQVAAIAEAIYESVRALGITYVNPPASWDMRSNPSTLGQRIRTPGEVIAERAGTCIDTAVLIASLLENAGLNPILTLVPGHGLVGYWRTDDDDNAFPASIWPIKSAMNLVDDGHIALFETTTVCGGVESEPFAAAIGEGRRRVVGSGALEASTESQSRFIDVVTARRRNRVFPIPAKITQTDGTVEVVEYKPREFPSTCYRQRSQPRAAPPGRASPRTLRRPGSQVEELAARPEPAQSAHQLPIADKVACRPACAARLARNHQGPAAVRLFGVPASAVQPDERAQPRQPGRDQPTGRRAAGDAAHHRARAGHLMHRVRRTSRVCGALHPSPGVKKIPATTILSSRSAPACGRPRARAR